MLKAENIAAYWQLARANRPIGIYLLLWPTLWALLIAAEGLPPWHITLVFCAGVAIMRSAGCVINDYADRHIDGKVKRTLNRPLITGQVSEKEAIALFVLLVFTAFLLVLTLNWHTVLLSVAALFLASLYPFMKRYTYLPQFVLGAAYSWGIPMAFMAVQQQIPWWAWLIYLANLLWTVAYDTQYAMVDRDDDIHIGVKSTAILFGHYDKSIIALLQLCTLCLIGVLAWQMNMEWPIYLAMLIVVGFFVYQQRLIWARAREQCFQAFLNNHYVGMILTLGLVANYLMY